MSDPADTIVSATDEVLVTRVNRTMVVTINRPQARNALTRNVLAGVTDALGAAATESETRCVVVTGAGGHFCAGADLRRTFAEDPELMEHLGAYMDAFHGIIRAIVRCPKPTIAMMEGAAVGFGADMALACDLRVASKTAYLQEKFVHIGLMPDGGGTFWLPRLLGTARAMKAMLLGDRIDAFELDALGVLAALTLPERLEEVTMDLAARLEKGPPLAFAALKQAVYANLGDVEDALRREREGQLRLLQTNDLLEGILAWTQKRDPEFKGS